MKPHLIPLSILSTLCAFHPLTSHADEPITVTTWNLEHLGSPGRGFGGGYGGNGRFSTPPRTEPLPLRTPAQLADIAKLIQNDLTSDIIAIQEVAITNKRRERSLNRPLSAIVKNLESNKQGADWDYFIPYIKNVPEHDEERNMHLGFLWNRNRVRLVKAFEMSLPDQVLAGKDVFKRTPLIGYFEEIRADGTPGIDFILINIHLASGQGNYENHLIALTLIQYGILLDTAKNAVSEPSIIILGDFNENPNKKDRNGNPLTSPALAAHMKFKGYTNLIKPEMKFTRMNNRLTSLIDHIMPNKSAAAHIIDGKATVYRPGNTPLGNKDLFAQWRYTYSDHFPLSFKIKSSKDNDPDFFR